MNFFDNTTIGRIYVKNHFVRSATYEGKATIDGRPTDDITKLYIDLTKGNVGTIITSYAYIANYEQPAEYQLGIYCDDMIEDYKKLTDEVHNSGGKIVMQIVHGSSISQGYPEKAVILGPSEITHPRSNLTPREMTKDDIENVIGLFASAAARVKKAGFDGVQIHSAHGYLLSQFISPIFNHRTDEYGGSVENRFRILEEVYTAIRDKVGYDYPIWIKINSTDDVERGLTVDEFLFMCKKLSDLGIDAIEVSGNKFLKYKETDDAYYREAAGKLISLVDTDVILTGGVRTLEQIERLHNNHNIKFFGFSRPLLKDVNYINKLK
ncbi:MAG: NADH:flavin oxidoreductase [Peptostreptococcus porci]|uniref:NADH:flavin oxidoreductase n=1 Tax=Peptostreptococcus porci TaxID=2652282 RepID=A0A6N7X0R3_9FIRM|nr:NADH:flavin oxidoreductase [Peptostreptococcus porci]MDY5479979.1 NADH:flavin oxidoreductase [Peptostreptococcus porci]MST62578.1 NADH:flavin oxidoreductase [Peptostreptococcus porci]